MNLRANISKAHREMLVLAALTCFFLGSTAIWLRLNRAPPQWDDSWYLTNSLVMFDALVEGGLFGYGKKFLTILGTKAPLITILPTPIYLLLGRNFKFAYLVNLFFMVVLFLSVYALAKRIRSVRSGLLAVYILGTMPLIYGLSRWYLVEYALTGLVCLAIYFLLASQGFRDARTAFAFGSTFGFGLLLKVSFPLYVGFPVVYVLIKSLLRTEACNTRGVSPESSRLKGALFLALPAVLLPLPWYLLNYRRVFKRALLSGFSVEAALYGTGEVFSLRAVKIYLVHLVNWGSSSYYALLALSVLGIISMTRRGRDFINTFRRDDAVLLLFWVLPFLVFLFGRNKDVRFTAPLLPAFALLLAFAMDFMLDRIRKWRRALMALIFAFPLVALLESSFGVLGYRRVRVGSFQFAAPSLGYAAVYDPNRWPQQDILKTLSKGVRFRGEEARLVVIGSDTASFNSNNFELAAREERLPFKLESTAYLNAPEQMLDLVNSMSFFVYKEGREPEPGLYNTHLNALLEQLHKNPKFVELRLGLKLPDGGTVHVFENASPDGRILRSGFIPANFDHLAVCQVDFDGKIQLTGLAVRQTPGSLDVQYRWLCLKTPDRDYWCFTHILDENNHLIGYLDHQVLAGNPSMTSWKLGDVAIEELRFQLSRSQAATNLRLRLGMFDMVSGERLRIVSATLPGGTRLPLTDEDTAVVVEGVGVSR